jgi:hypothetical protein
MPQDHRPPGEHVINVRVSVDIIEPRPFGAPDEARLPSDGPEGADRTIHTTWNELLGFSEELGRSASFHNGGAPYHAARERVKKSTERKRKPKIVSGAIEIVSIAATFTVRLDRSPPTS